MMSYYHSCVIPANTRHWPNVVLILARRLGRRPSIKTTLGQCLVLAGLSLHGIQNDHDSETHHYIIFWVRQLHSKPGMESYCWSSTDQFSWYAYGTIISQVSPSCSLYFCKSKSQYLLTCKVSRYCLLAFHGSTVRVTFTIFYREFILTLEALCYRIENFIHLKLGLAIATPIFKLCSQFETNKFQMSMLKHTYYFQITVI